MDNTVRSETLGFISKEFGLIHIASIVSVVCILAGLILSIMHVFTNRDKTETEKIFMLYFAVFADIYIALNAGSHITATKLSLWFLLLPIWNGLNAVTLLLRFYNQHEETSKVLSLFLTFPHFPSLFLTQSAKDLTFASKKQTKTSCSKNGNTIVVVLVTIFYIPISDNK